MAGCAVNSHLIAEGRAKHTKGLTPQAKSQTIRFTAERDVSPEPFVEGSFIDANHAWVAGFYLRRTIDGGKTWQKMLPAKEFENEFGSIGGCYFRPYFVTPNRGWVVACSATWQTDDGGLTWKRLFPQGSDRPYFSDTQNGWADVRVTETTSQIFKTSNGGEEWQPCGPEFIHQSQSPTGVASFLDPNEGWSLTSDFRESDRRIIYGVAHTKDGGCNWEQIWVSSENPDEYYSDIFFLNQNEGWIAGNAIGSISHTNNGGKTWTRLPLPKEMARVSSIYFSDSNNGWALVNDFSSEKPSGIFYTKDGGRKWQALTESELANDNFNPLPASWKAGWLFRTLKTTRGEVKQAL
jgi:photosystem II stability/assembly factor-like uncharacterized protein